ALGPLAGPLLIQGLGDRRRVLGQGGALEEGAYRQLDAEALTHPVGETGGEEGVAAELPEVVVDPQPVDLQQGSPEAGDLFFEMRARGDVLVPGVGLGLGGASLELERG